MKEREGFTFYRSFKDSLSGLSDTDKLLMYESICDYALNGIEPSLDGFSKSLFILIQPYLKSERTKFLNGCKGGAPIGSLNNLNGRRGNSLELTKSKPRTNLELTENKPTPIINVKCKMNNEKDNKENNKKKAGLSFTERQQKFYESLIPYTETYGKELIRAFFDYWAEPNSSKTKMRFELQKTWDVAGRLRTWERRQNNGK